MEYDNDEGPRAFARFFENLADGDAHAEASEKLHELGAALSEHSRFGAKASGKLTLELTLKAEGGQVDVHYAVKLKKPDPKRPRSTLWLTQGGNLSRANPNQQDLPGLREVPTSQTVKEVAQ